MSRLRKLSPTMEHAILVLAGEVEGSPLDLRTPTLRSLYRRKLVDRFPIRLDRFPIRLSTAGHIVATLLVERNMARDYIQSFEVTDG